MNKKKQKVVLNLNDLKMAAQNCFAFVNPKATIPIAENFKIIFKENGEYYISATNLESEIIHRLAYEGGEKFTFCINAMKFHKTISSLVGDTVNLTLYEDNRVVVSQKRRRFTFPTVDPEEFPSFKGQKDINGFFIQTSDIQEGLGDTQKVVNAEELRPDLRGVSLMYNPEKENTVVIGPSTEKMIFNFIDTEKGPENQIDFILNKTFCQAFSRMNYREKDIEVGASEDGKRAFFYTKNVKINTLLVKEKYFKDTMSFLDKFKDHYKVHVPYDSLFQALSRINGLMKNGKKYTLSTLCFYKDSIYIMSIDKDYNEKVVEVIEDVKLQNEEMVHINLNTSNLLITMDSIRDNNVLIAYKDTKTILSVVPSSSEARIKRFSMFMPMVSYYTDEEIEKEIQIDEV